MRRISSRQNPVVARFRELARDPREGRWRSLLEGEHLVAEALASGVPIDTSRSPNGGSERGCGSSAERVESAGGEALRVSDPVMAALSPAGNHRVSSRSAGSRQSSLDDALRTAPQLLVCPGAASRMPATSARSCAPPTAAAPPASSRRTAPPIRSDGRRCAARWAARSVPVACASAARGDARISCKRQRSTIVATVPRGGTPLPDADCAGRLRSCLAGGRGSARSDRRGRRQRAHDPDAPAGRVAQRRHRGGADTLRSCAQQRSEPTLMSLFDEPRRPSRPRSSIDAARRAHAAAHARRVSSARNAVAPGRPLRQAIEQTACSRSSCGARPAPAKRRSRASSPP